MKLTSVHNLHWDPVSKLFSYCHLVPFSWTFKIMLPTFLGYPVSIKNTVVLFISFSLVCTAIFPCNYFYPIGPLTGLPVKFKHSRNHLLCLDNRSCRLLLNDCSPNPFSSSTITTHTVYEDFEWKSSKFLVKHGFKRRKAGIFFLSHSSNAFSFGDNCVCIALSFPVTFNTILCEKFANCLLEIILIDWTCAFAVILNGIALVYLHQSLWLCG